MTLHTGSIPNTVHIYSRCSKNREYIILHKELAQPLERRPEHRAEPSQSSCGGSQPAFAPRTAPAATYLHPSSVSYRTLENRQRREEIKPLIDHCKTWMASMHIRFSIVIRSYIRRARACTHLQPRRRWRRGRRRWGTRPGTPTSRAPGRSGGPRPWRWRRGGPARRGRPRRHARRRRSLPTRPGPARRPPPTSGTGARPRACAPARTASRLTTPRTRTRPAAAPRTPADHLHHASTIDKQNKGNGFNRLTWQRQQGYTYHERTAQRRRGRGERRKRRRKPLTRAMLCLRSAI